MTRLDGRVALITGAGRGIGREEALYFAAEGANVVVNDAGVSTDGTGGDPGVAAAVADEIVARGGVAVANSDSVTDWLGAQRMVEAALDAFGDLHVVVNNAGITRNRPLADLTEAEFDEVVAVKLKGTFAVSHHAARYWRDAERADRALINTSSGSGLRTPLPTQTNYAAANAGVAAMTIVNALELSAYGVRANCLAPSMARTRLTADVPGMSAPPPSAADGSGTPDPMHPRWIAPVAAYLATPDCPYTGQVITVRGASVVLNNGWSPGAQVAKEPDSDALWTVDELAEAMADLPREDVLATFTEAVTGALGADAHTLIRQILGRSS